MPSGVTVEKVTVIGAGIGGLYLVAELGLAGFQLRLHDIDAARLAEIRARGGDSSPSRTKRQVFT